MIQEMYTRSLLYTNVISHTHTAFFLLNSLTKFFRRYTGLKGDVTAMLLCTECARARGTMF